MGVQARVVVFAPDEPSRKRGAEIAFARLSDLDAKMSDYRPASELNQLCAAPCGTPHLISGDLFAVLQTATRVSEATTGAFDISLGPCVSLWRAARKNERLATDNEIRTAQSRCGFSAVRSARDSLSGATTATLTKASMQLDLGGIAKGYAVAEGVKSLRSAGYRSCLVALAGDIAVGDAPPGSTAWAIAVADATGKGEAGVIHVSNVTISTSGDAEQFVEIDGRRYSHTLDPRTGLGTSGDRCVTVVSADGAVSDALATALCVPWCPPPETLVRSFAGTAIIVQDRGSRGPIVCDPDRMLTFTFGPSR